MIQLNDLVIVNRPRLPARIGRVVRLGKRVHVRFKPNTTKRFAYGSVETLLRERVPPSKG